MPVANHAAVSAGVIAISVAVAAAIAIYESPELRRYADDIRRRIAIALHSLGDGINPEDREPLFNRPEDAEGFLQSHSGLGGEAGVDADEATQRRQREELMYWNALHAEKKAKEQREAEENTQRQLASRGSSFDDFLRQDDSAERGTFVFNSGADVQNQQDREGLVRRRGEGVRGLNSSLHDNPFADQYDIAEIPEPRRDEAMSDIYSATTQDPAERIPDTILYEAPLIDVESNTSRTRSATLERDPEVEEYMTAGQLDRADAYASIQSWAQGSTHDFYSPLPMSPPVPISEPELISNGEATPTDSASLAGSGEDVGNDAASSHGAEDGRHFDVLSESDGMATPASWSEVGSVVSDTEPPMHT